MSKISQQYIIFAPSDGPPRGTGHGEWLKMQIKNKYIRGEASKKVSKTEACILRNQAKSESTATQLRPRVPPLTVNLPLPLTMKQTPTNFSMPEIFVTYSTLPTSELTYQSTLPNTP